MIGTAREIALEMFRCADLDAEKYVFASWDSNDIRSICVDWDLSSDEIETIMERLSTTLDYGGCVSLIHGIVEEMIEEKREHRTVTIPATSLEMVMQLAGREMQRIAVCAEDGGGSAEETLKEENDVMMSLRAALEA
ncbi:DUF1380 domain-containing protein [Salmonella enterica subsp. enterica serovar Infantis]|uniref:hypothetical protein n=1 Tax=Enterobacter cloacae complex TaxID=354276 RepID=UPI0014106D4D|nr:DUF1380 domain-containing protein [Salmonella enterica subsp. enterica serovar Infantis]EDM3610448.1 hypothetical protein [Salmonella enterica subsp. enterica serovar Infantis]EFS2925524.1 DUF1380 domain-containing protein [Salmonella enterica]HCM3688691.1 DUF1380 family protein [Salmonella enterica subsp. enterica serovar Anatum]